jgi:multiple sugar transport system substrate-binding protein
MTTPMMTRRDFLKTSSLTLGAAALAGCGRPFVDPNTLIFKGWGYEPDIVRENIERFMQRHPDIPVDYQAVSGQYHDKMVALFVAGTPVDCCYVRDDNFAEWVEADWLQPIDDLPGAKDYLDDFFDFNREAMIYDGKLYGLPYYADFAVWIYNEPLLRAAGFEKPGRTWDEITEQAIKIKEKKLENPDGQVVEYPISFALKQTVLGFNDWWAMNYASEVDLFDDEMNPRFPDDDGRRAEQVLQWLVDGIHQHNIIDIGSLNLDGTEVRADIAAGRLAFASISKYDLEWVNNRTKSLLADAELKKQGKASATHAKVWKMSLYPSLSPHLRGTLGWTRMYCLTKNSRFPEKAWKLVQYLGGKDEDGRYYTAKRWYCGDPREPDGKSKARGLGFCYQSLMNDPDIIAFTEVWGDMNLIREQSRFVRARENIKAAWFPDFDAFYQPEIQRVLLKEQTPRDGLARIAAHCRKLKKEWQG